MPIAQKLSSGSVRFPWELHIGHLNERILNKNTNLRSVWRNVVIAESVWNTSHANSVIVTSVSDCLHDSTSSATEYFGCNDMSDMIAHLPLPAIPMTWLQFIHVVQTWRWLNTMVNQFIQIVIGDFYLVRFDGKKYVWFCGTSSWLWCHTQCSAQVFKRAGCHLKRAL